MKNHESKILENVKSFLGLDNHDYSKINRLDLGSQHIQNYISELFKLKAASLTQHDTITSAFNKTQNNMYLDDPFFVKTFTKEMTGRGVPKPEINDAIEYVDNILDKIVKEFGSSNAKDGGWNPNMDEIEETSKPEQNIESEIVKPRKGHTQNSNIESDMPIDRPKAKRITESEEMEKLEVPAMYLQPGDYLPHTQTTIVGVTLNSVKWPSNKCMVHKTNKRGERNDALWGKRTEISVLRPVQSKQQIGGQITEGIQGNEYITAIETETPYEYISADIAVQFDAEPAEPRTRDYPGSPGRIIINGFKILKLEIYDAKNYMEPIQNGRLTTEGYKELINAEFMSRREDIETEIAEDLNEQDIYFKSEAADLKRRERRERFNDF